MSPQRFAYNFTVDLSQIEKTYKVLRRKLLIPDLVVFLSFPSLGIFGMTTIWKLELK